MRFHITAHHQSISILSPPPRVIPWSARTVGASHEYVLHFVFRRRYRSSDHTTSGCRRSTSVHVYVSEVIELQNSSDYTGKAFCGPRTDNTPHILSTGACQNMKDRNRLITCKKLPINNYSLSVSAGFALDPVSKGRGSVP